MGKTKYQQIKTVCLAAGARNTIPVQAGIGEMLRGVIVSATVNVKVEVYADNISLVTIFNSHSNQTVQANFNLDPNANNVVVTITNREISAADTYVTVLLEDNWDVYSTQFDRALEKTLTT